MNDEVGDLDPEKLLKAGLGGEEEGGIDPEWLARAFPNLEFLAMLGRGGMGVVYRARQKSLDRVVAVKILLPEIGGDAAFAERFAREAKALAKLDHPNIVRVYEAGESDGLYFLILEHVDGVNLRQAMKDGGIAPAEALRIVPQVCDALQYAHDRGIVHRDVKPENILLARGGQVKIADFGLAKLVGDRLGDASLTGASQVMGTLHYIAPEQIRTPKEVDHRADVYSLGVVFYEMLTGDLPIGRFPSPSEMARVDARIDAVVLRTLERERDLRYQHVSEVKTGIESAGEPAHRAHRTRGPAREGGELSHMAVLGALGLPIALLVWTLVFSLGARDEHATLVAAAVAILGVGLSVLAHLEIKRSGGRLRGGRLAKAGIVLPPLLALLLLVTALVIYFGFFEPQVSREREQVRLEAAAAQSRAQLEARVQWSLVQLVTLGPAVTPSDLQSLVAPSVRAELELFGPEEFLRRHGDEAGLPFTDMKTWPGPLRDFRIVDAVLEGDHARVTISNPSGTLRFPMVREGGEWYFGLGPVEIRKR